MSNELRKMAEQNKILEIVAGSHLYGTNTPESDEDFVGIFMPPPEYVYGLQTVKEVDFSIIDKGENGKNTADAIDRKLYEFRKFISLAQGNNPNIMEMLFVPEKSIKYISDIGKKLLAVRDLFPSKQAVPKFKGYANSQKHKMIIRRDHFNDLREGYNTLCKMGDNQCLIEVMSKEHLILDEKSNAFRPLFWTKEGAKHIHIGDLCFEPGLYVKKVRKKLKERLDKVTNRSELVLKHGYDTKFGSHLIRLLYEGLDILNEGKLTFPLKNADFLLNIKNGALSLKEILELADDLEAQYEKAEKKSNLPKTPNFNRIEKFTIETLQEFLHPKKNTKL